jgi:hypothetical protein
MLTNPEPNSSPSRNILKSPLLYSSTVVAIALLAVGWIMYARWENNRQIDRRLLEERAQKQREGDRVALQQFGGKDLAIQSFYASPGLIHRGESTQLCYGVANAKTVKLEPQSNPVWPSYGRCVSVSPAKTTTYTLTVTDAAHNTLTQSVEVKVQ